MADFWVGQTCHLIGGNMQHPHRAIRGVVDLVHFPLVFDTLSASASVSSFRVAIKPSPGNSLTAVLYLLRRWHVDWSICAWAGLKTRWTQLGGSALCTGGQCTNSMQPHQRKKTGPRTIWKVDGKKLNFRKTVKTFKVSQNFKVKPIPKAGYVRCDKGDAIWAVANMGFAIWGKRVGCGEHVDDLISLVDFGFSSFYYSVSNTLVCWFEWQDGLVESTVAGNMKFTKQNNPWLFGQQWKRTQVGAKWKGKRKKR